MEPPNCPLCNSPSRLLCPGTFPIYHCQGKDCGVGWSPPTTPIPDEAAFSEPFFEEYYAPRASALTASFGAYLDELKPYLPGSRWLDVGCGGGYFAAAASGRGWDVTGIDTSSAAVALAGQVAPRARFLRCTAGDLPVDPAFDVISFWDSLVYIPDLSEQLRNCIARLSTGGALVVKTPHMPPRFLEGARYLLWWRPVLRDEITQVHSTRWFFTPNSLGNVLRQHGLSLAHENWSQEVPCPPADGSPLKIKVAVRNSLINLTRSLIGKHRSLLMVFTKRG